MLRRKYVNGYRDEMLATLRLTPPSLFHKLRRKYLHPTRADNQHAYTR